MKHGLRVYAHALRQSARGGSLRSVARAPLVREAALMLQQLESVDLSDITGHLTFNATVSAPETRHAWSLHAADQLVLEAIVVGRGVKTAFEIGTFNGGTTRVLAEALPSEGRVWTLDLPVDTFDATQGPDAFRGAQVGRAFLGSPSAHKIEQIRADSRTYDFALYEGKCDLVLVDGGHEYEHGVADTRTAFRLLAPGGIILWDDFQPHWHGLVRGILLAAGLNRPRRLAGTSMGVWFDDARSSPSG